MIREEALSLLKEKIRSDVLIKHSLATEAIMVKLAEVLGEDKEKWGLCGLLHDLDFEETKDNAPNHTLVTSEILLKKEIPEDIIVAIQEHNAEAIGRTRETKMGIALTASESITGLIVATTLVLPDRRLGSLNPNSVRKRMKEKAFAKNVSRESILECERIGQPLERFIELSVDAMRGISDILGL
ncbi:MAG: HDIG domain-containing metalloprotein [Acidobacteriota bacterium]